MTGEIIPWPSSLPDTGGPSFRVRVEGILAIFRAIDAGELLSALPECDVARMQHTTALALLAMAERELMSLHEILGPIPDAIVRLAHLVGAGGPS